MKYISDRLRHSFLESGLFAFHECTIIIPLREGLPFPLLWSNGLSMQINIPENILRLKPGGSNSQSKKVSGSSDISPLS
jgi:hypothetical protein